MLLRKMHSLRLNCGSYLKQTLIKYEYFHTSTVTEAGHSKWANIRHIKALKDGQKSAMFTRYSRQIRLAIQDGGSSDPALNSSLRSVIDDALRKNMPMGTIQNVIKKSAQNKSLLKKYYLHMRYHQKVFLVCVLYTDNFVQLKMELASVLKKFGTVYIDGQHLFDDMGIIETTLSDDMKAKAKSVDELEQICFEHAIDCRVEEVEVIDPAKGIVNFTCSPHELVSVSRALSEKGYMIESSEHIFIPKSTVTLNGEELKAYENFLKRLREFSGIEDIYDNLEVNEQ